VGFLPSFRSSYPCCRRWRHLFHFLHSLSSSLLTYHLHTAWRTWGAPLTSKFTPHQPHHAPTCPPLSIHSSTIHTFLHDYYIARDTPPILDNQGLAFRRSTLLLKRLLSLAFYLFRRRSVFHEFMCSIDSIRIPLRSLSFTKNT